MPATSLTKVTALNYADGIPDAGFEAADQSNSNDFANTGKEVVSVINGSGGTLNVTYTLLPASKYTVNDVLTKTPSGGVVANGGQAFLGPFDPAIYGNTVTLAYDTDTSVTVAVVTMQDTPI